MNTKRSRHFIISLLTSFPLLVIVALFILIHPDGWNSLFWTSIGVLAISLLLSWAAPLFITRVPKQNFVIGTTYYGIVSFYSALSILAIIILGFVWPVGIRVYLVIHLVLLFVSMLLLGLFGIFNEEVHDNSNEHLDTRNLRNSFDMAAQDIIHKIQVHEFDEVDHYIHKFNTLIDKIKWSDPTTNAHSIPYEKEFMSALEELSTDLIKEDKIMSVEEFDLAIDHIIYLVDRRNTALKTYK